MTFFTLFCTILKDPPTVEVQLIVLGSLLTKAAVLPFLTAVLREPANNLSRYHKTQLATKF